MRRFLAGFLLLGLVLPLFAASVGSGAPTASIQQSFINAYDRGQFSVLADLPTTNVQSFGTPGLVQEFPSKANSKILYALVKPDPNALPSANDTLQVFGDLYAYYTSVGVSTAGYPTIDTTPCPANSFGTCDYQLFANNYALFAYSVPVTANFTVRDPFYTEWNSLGGIAGAIGLVTSRETAVTSLTKVQGTQQLFAGGTIFTYPAAATTPTVHGIAEPANTAFNGAGGYAVLGFPTTEAFAVGPNSTPPGLMRQLFEGGRIEWTASTMPVVIFPLAEVDITYANLGIFLAPGASAVVAATSLDTHGLQVSDRALTWSTSNGAVATVAGNGYTATVHAVSGGSANIYVTAEGKTSAPLAVHVSSTCCAIGEGAPTQTISQAFQTAIDRNHLAVTLPSASTVTRAGNGYTQTLTASDGSGAVYVIAEADNSPTAYLLTGALYTAFNANGGFSGALGYPASDPLPGGVQKFLSGAALAGTPPRAIPAAIAVKWFLLGGLSGAMGPPAADATALTSFSGANGVSQAFANGTIFGATSGSRAELAYFSSGLILARYLALSGPAGPLGFPTSDVSIGGAVQTQNFETGFIDLQPGAAVAVEHFNPRHPALSPVPATVVPGGRVHISATGFAPGATLAFTITGQPGFSVQTVGGTFEWDVLVPAGAKAGTVSIQATAAGGADTAAGSYTVSPVAALLPKLSIVSGDRQTGIPGGSLAAPLIARLVDSTGSPVAGVPVFWTASPGSNAQSSFVTDQNGLVSLNFRLPPAAGVVLGSLSAAGQVAGFSALASAASIQNFPAPTGVPGFDSFTSAFAALLRFAQNAGQAAAPNGPATFDLLRQFLIAMNGYGINDTGTVAANPWVAAKFANAGILVEPASADRIRDLLNAGQPCVVILSLSIDGSGASNIAVDAVGEDAFGSILIADPNSAWDRPSLADYANGFSIGGHQWQAVPSLIVSLAPPLSGSPFTVSSQVSAGASVSSPAGPCASLDYSGARFHFCDGTQPNYEIDFANPKGAMVVDLSGGATAQVPPGVSAAFSIARAGGAFTVAAQKPTIGGVTDSAAFAAAVSPGGLFTIFGAGLSAGPAMPSVSVNGVPASVVAAFPFQINAVMPVGTAVGPATVQVSNTLGTVSKSVTLAAVSPGIFQVGALGAILNQDASLNSPASPAQRGQFISIYCTGLGATALKGGLQVATAAVTVKLNGVTLVPSYAGLVAGFPGLYQVNVTIPAGQPPGLTGALTISQSGQTSNTVPVALQ